MVGTLSRVPIGPPAGRYPFSLLHVRIWGSRRARTAYSKDGARPPHVPDGDFMDPSSKNVEALPSDNVIHRGCQAAFSHALSAVRPTWEF